MIFKKTNSILIRVDPEFKRLLTELKIEELKNGRTNKLLSDRKLTEVIAKNQNIKNILFRRTI